MYLLYLDDSGSPDDPKQDHFVLGGICLHEQKLHWISKYLDDLAIDIDPDHPNTVEFHAAEIFRGKTKHWKGMPKDKRIETIKKVLDAVNVEDRNTTIFACAVHKPSFSGGDPVENAFEDLCNRFDLFLKRLYKQQDTEHKGLIVLDKSTYETNLQRLSLEFRQLGTRWGVTRNLNEVPLFVDSKATRLIQLADHIAYAVYRRYQAADLNYFNVIEGQFDSEGDRIHGLCHKTSHSDCTCPSCLSRRLSNSR